MNAFELSRNWFNFSFENPDKVKPIHTAIYFFTIERCNRLGWKEKFSLPTDMSMEANGIKSYKTYKKALKEIVEFGFIKMHQESKNQWTANIIALVKNTKALSKADNEATAKALDKAMIKHTPEHEPKQVQSTDHLSDSIIKQRNNVTTKQVNKGKPTQIFLNLNSDKKEIFQIWLEYRKEIKKGIKNEKTLEGLIKKFNNHKLDDCKKIVSYSIDNNYQGLFWDRLVKTDKKTSFSKNR